MIERIWAVGGEVVRVNPVRRTLEEIFIQLTALPVTTKKPPVQRPAPVSRARGTALR